MSVSREAVLWAYRLLQGREPHSESEIQEQLRLETETRLVRNLIDLRETGVATGRTAPRPELEPAEKRRRIVRKVLRMGPPAVFSREAVTWAYRLLLGREPESEAVLREKMRARDRLELLEGFLSCDEFVRRTRSWPRCRPITTPHGQRTVDIADLPEDCICSQSLRKIGGVVLYPAEQEDKLSKLKLYAHGPIRPEDISGVHINLRSLPQLTICISHPGQTVAIGKGNTGVWTLRMWGRSTVEIGDGCTSNGTLCWVTWGGSLRIGQDCMFAEFINIHVGDNHAIFDVNTLAPTNYKKAPTVTIGNHVWVATGATVLADTVIGSGSIVAAQAVVKGEIAECSLAAGIPARVNKSGVSWTRSHDGSDAEKVVERFNLRTSQRAATD